MSDFSLEYDLRCFSNLFQGVSCADRHGVRRADDLRVEEKLLEDAPDLEDLLAALQS